MSLSLIGFTLLGNSVQIAMRFRFPRRVYRGRILTRPLWRLVPLFGREPIGQMGCRISQIIALGFGIPHSRGFDGVYYTSLIALYFDDWATGDDDRWKRFTDRVRNSIKWLMQLPAPPEAEAA